MDGHQARQEARRSIIVIDPKRIRPSRSPILWLRPKPGTDAAIAMAMISEMIEAGLYDKDFVAGVVHGFDELAERVREFHAGTRGRADGRAGRRHRRRRADVCARTLDFRQRPWHRCRSATACRPFARFIASSRSAAMSTGKAAIGAPSGPRASRQPTWICCTIRDSACPGTSKSRPSAPTAYPLWAGPRGWQTACHNRSVIDAILTGKPYPVRGMYVSGVNIAIMYPNTRRNARGVEARSISSVSPPRP